MAGEQSRWIFTRPLLAATPSRKCGIDSDKELNMRQQAANLIQEMGQKLQVTQLCINTAMVYMHRFYMVQSFSKFNRNQMATACLFLAAKVEEQPRKLEHVLRFAHTCLHHPEQLDAKSKQYLDLAQELVVNENILLQSLGFEITVDHPHRHVVSACQLVRASKDLTQTSYFLATNSLHLTTMSLQYRPTVVACVCIHLACKWSNFEIPKSSEGKEWFQYTDKHVTVEQLEELTIDFLAILDKCPSKLKKKLMNSKNNMDGAGKSSQPVAQGIDRKRPPPSAAQSRPTSQADRRRPSPVKPASRGQQHAGEASSRGHPPPSEEARGSSRGHPPEEARGHHHSDSARGHPQSSEFTPSNRSSAPENKSLLGKDPPQTPTKPFVSPPAGTPTVEGLKRVRTEPTLTHKEYRERRERERLERERIEKERQKLAMAKWDREGKESSHGATKDSAQSGSLASRDAHLSHHDKEHPGGAADPSTRHERHHLDIFGDIQSAPVDNKRTRSLSNSSKEKELKSPPKVLSHLELKSPTKAHHGDRSVFDQMNAELLEKKSIGRESVGVTKRVTPEKRVPPKPSVHAPPKPSVPAPPAIVPIRNVNPSSPDLDMIEQMIEQHIESKGNVSNHEASPEITDRLLSPVISATPVCVVRPSRSPLISVTDMDMSDNDSDVKNTSTDVIDVLSLPVEEESSVPAEEAPVTEPEDHLSNSAAEGDSGAGIETADFTIGTPDSERQQLKVKLNLSQTNTMSPSGSKKDKERRRHHKERKHERKHDREHRHHRHHHRKRHHRDHHPEPEVEAGEIADETPDIVSETVSTDKGLKLKLSLSKNNSPSVGAAPAVVEERPSIPPMKLTLSRDQSGHYSSSSGRDKPSSRHSSSNRNRSRSRKRPHSPAEITTNPRHQSTSSSTPSKQHCGDQASVTDPASNGKPLGLTGTGGSLPRSQSEAVMSQLASLIKLKEYQLSKQQANSPASSHPPTNH